MGFILSMPAYSFICQKCKNNFDLNASFGEYDRKDPKKFYCPKCHSKKIVQSLKNIYFIKKDGKNPVRCNCNG